MPAGDDSQATAQIELLQSLNTVVEENLSLLLPLDQAWQPTDFLPDLSAEDWQKQLSAFRAASTELSDEVLVVLVGGMVTEEALPNYAISLNLLAQDETGTSKTPWARWLRGWTSEENRHGDLLNAYLRLTGRVNMRAIETTVHHLIAGGFNPRANSNLYSGLIYTSFQERATKISHARVGTLATQHGDEHLADICKKIAGDESRHEAFYTRMMGEVMQRDPDAGMLTFKDLMRRIIAMPGRLMNDGKDPDLFEHFASVAQRIGVYTAHDYAQILAHLVKTWEIGSKTVSGAAAAAQEFLCQQAEKLGSMADAITEKASKQAPVEFSWIYDRRA